MKIYLAGKIAKNDWRHEIVEGLRSVDGAADDDGWTVLTRSVFGEHDYTGPFFVSCDHGGFHGDNSHGLGARAGDFGGHAPINCCDSDVPARRDIFNECARAIAASDAVYFWLDSQDAYGSLVELGMAMALKKKTCVAYSNDGDFDDHWFAMVGASVSIPADDAADGLRSFLADRSMRGVTLVERCESPIERQFILAAVDAIPAWVGKLDVQTPVRCEGRTFRLDATLVTKTAKLAIELDGHAFHERTKEQAQHDKSRDRLLAGEGWTVLRFTGSEIYADATRCALEVLKVARAGR